MQAIENTAKARLEAGEVAIGVGLRQARTVDIGKIMKTCGFDWLFIDMEHNSMSIDMAAQISVAAQDAGITPIVRVPGFQHFHATRVLDSGAQGIVVPHVDSAEVAAQMVSNCRYPPVGHRSVTGTLPQVNFESRPPSEVTRDLNDSTLLVLMIETPLAVENADEIAAVEGVDALLIGASDLCMEMGIPGQFDHPDVIAAFERVLAACRAHNKHPGFGGVYTQPLMERYMKMGMRLVLSGSDIAFMMSGARQRSDFIRNANI
jgi:2-keto-3-deoxy-L-rhamnonate aldolase RhmA